MLAKRTYNDRYGFDIFDYLFNQPLKTSTSFVKEDFSEDEKSYTMRLAVPGFEENELQIHVTGNTLTVTGKHERKEGEKEKHFFMESNSFSRSYMLEHDAVIDNATAEYKAGILVVTIPRNAKSNANKQIPIKTG